MQDVYQNGNLGEIEDYDAELLQLKLSNPQIDHVRVFLKPNGNKVGVPEIEDKKLEDIVEKKLEERARREAIRHDYKLLTSQFDRALRRVR